MLWLKWSVFLLTWTSLEVFGLPMCGSLISFRLIMPEKSWMRPNFTEKNLGDAQFNATRDYKILLHGWTGHSKTKWYKIAIKEYMRLGTFNVIVVDYEEAMADRLYLNAAKNVPLLGRAVGRMIHMLHTKKKIPLYNLHMVGHSLGAHIAGIAGETVYKLTGRKVGRITGLDPAFPGFYYTHRQLHGRLSADDAEFVDVIHTSVFGIYGVIGTVDFFPNGGTMQAGCSYSPCSHDIAATFFCISIAHNETFPAHKCDSYHQYRMKQCRPSPAVFMGEHVNKRARGIYYLSTDPQLAKDDNHGLYGTYKKFMG